MIKNDTTWCTPRGGAKDEKKNDKDYGSIGHPNAVLDTVLISADTQKKRSKIQRHPCFAYTLEEQSKVFQSP